MSDLREAFEALEELASIASDHPGIPGNVYYLRDTVKAAMQSVEGASGAQQGEAPPFIFDRYINGTKMAQGVQIEKQLTLDTAAEKAALLAAKGPNGETPVLVCISHPVTAPQPAQLPKGWKLRCDGDELILSSPGDNHCVVPRHKYAPDHVPQNMFHDLLRAMLAAAPSGDAKPVQQGKNRYGLDIGYFSRLIAREFGDLANFTPDEFARVAARMAKTACASVLQESEFSVDSGDAKREAGINSGQFYEEIANVLRRHNVAIIAANDSAPFETRIGFQFLNDGFKNELTDRHHLMHSDIKQAARIRQSDSGDHECCCGEAEEAWWWSRGHDDSDGVE